MGGPNGSGTGKSARSWQPERGHGCAATSRVSGSIRTRRIVTRGRRPLRYAAPGASSTM